MKWVIAHKDKISSLCGLLGGIAWSGLTTIQAFDIPAPNKARWVLGAVSAICFGVVGWLTGKKAEEAK